MDFSYTFWILVNTVFKKPIILRQVLETKRLFFLFWQVEPLCFETIQAEAAAFSSPNFFRILHSASVSNILPLSFCIWSGSNFWNSVWEKIPDRLCNRSIRWLFDCFPRSKSRRCMAGLQGVGYDLLIWLSSSLAPKTDWHVISVLPPALSAHPTVAGGSPVVHRR